MGLQDKEKLEAKIIEKVTLLIRENEFKLAIETLAKLPELKTISSILHGRLSNTKEQERKQLITMEEARVSYNKLAEDIFQLVSGSTTYRIEEIRSPLIPLLPVNYVQREEYAIIETTLLEGNDRYYGITGISGSGKSILATALARSKNILIGFDGGVFWVGTSEKVKNRFADGSPIPYQEQLYIQFQNDPESRLRHTTWQENLVQLQKLSSSKFVQKKCLIIVDDPPADSDVLEALEIHENVVFLVTTYNLSILYAKGVKQNSIFRLKGLSKDEASELLSIWTDTAKNNLPDIAQIIVQKLDYLPLAVTMIGAVIKGTTDSKTAWTDIFEAIEEADLGDISHHVDNYPHRNLSTVIQLAINTLDETYKSMLFSLSMFPQGWRFEFKDFSTIWGGRKDRKIRKLIQNLVGIAIIQSIGSNYYVLHSLVRLYLRKNTDDLLKSYQNAGPLLFPDIPLPVLATGWQDELALDILINDGINVDQVLPEGFSALHVASERGYRKIVDMLLDAGAVIDRKGKLGVTALRQAAFFGHLDVVDSLLQHGAFVDAQDKEGFAALHVASQKGHLEIVRKLLQTNATPNLPNKSRKSPLFVSAYNNHPDVVKELLRYLPLDKYETDFSESALRISAYKGYIDVVRVLLNAGVEVNWSSPQSPGTVLHAAAQGGHFAIVDLLIEAGANIESKSGGVTALCLAAQGGYEKVVSRLISAEADVNATGEDNYTPLHSAVAGNHNKIVHMLIEANAKVNAQLVESLVTPLHFAAEALNIGIMQSLIDAGADINLQTINGYTALHIALKRRFDIVLPSAVSQASFSITEQGGSFASAVTVSAHDGLPIIELLLKNGVLLDLVDSNGNTPLHISAYNGDFKSTKLLLDLGALSDLKNLQGKTPIDLATEQSNNPIKTMLSGMCAQVNYKGVIEILNSKQQD